MIDTPLINYTVEILCHFECPACRRWRSVADGYPAGERISCPFCEFRSSARLIVSPENDDQARQLIDRLSNILFNQGESYDAVGEK